MQPQRAIDLNSGTAMIITDLHGSWPVYELLRDRFLELKAESRADHLVICGDLIHGYGPESQDGSLNMLTDVMRLQQELGPEHVIMLLGNHEMPHIYGLVLSKGDREFTSRFERLLTAWDADRDKRYTREDILRFLRSLPFFVRTRAGVLLTHAGASAYCTTVDAAEFVLSFDHDALLRLADDKINNSIDLGALRASQSYREQVEQFMGIRDPNDPRFVDLLRGQLLSQTNEEFDILWNLLFTYNEQGDNDLRSYEQIAGAFLNAISAHSPYPQRLLVAGHISARGGYDIIGSYHLRLATFTHAIPNHAGRYLLLNCAEEISSMADLVANLESTFQTNGKIIQR